MIGKETALSTGVDIPIRDLNSYTMNFVMCAATHVFAQIFCMDQSDQVHFTAINFLFEQCYSEVLPHAVTSNDMFSSGCVCDEGPSAYFWECCSFNQLKEDCST